MSQRPFTSTDLSFSEVEDLPYEDRVVKHIEYVIPYVTARNEQLEVKRFYLSERSFWRVEFTNGERETWHIFDCVMDRPDKIGYFVSVGYFVSGGKKYATRGNVAIETVKEPL